MFFWQSTFAQPFGYAPLPPAVELDAISYGWYGLQNANIVVTRYDFDDSGASEFNSYPIPRTDGTGFLSRYWRKKTIRIEGYVKATTEAGLQMKIDELKKAVGSQDEKELRYSTPVSDRVITATLSSADFNRQHYNLTFLPFSLTFESSDAFWRDANNESVSFAGETVWPRSENITNVGSGYASPRAYFALSSATSVTEISFSAGGRTITVPGSFVSGSLVAIDGEKKEVRIDGTLSDYSGTFPEFAPGSNVVSYSIDGTATADVITVWRKNYL